MADEVEAKRTPSEAEDIPSDFFDDFSKDEFMEGLSVIDSWDDEAGKRNRESRYNAEVLGGVDDLRQLLRDGDEDRRRRRGRDTERSDRERLEQRRIDREHERERGNRRRSNEYHRSNIDDYIKPGSRRDPNKTNAAIRKDKEVKVKEYLAKHIEQDIRPPGTELDDYFDESKPLDSKKPVVSEEVVVHNQEARSQSKDHRRHESPASSRSRRRSQRRSPQKSPLRRRSRDRSPRRSPRRSPHRSFRHSPRHSPYRRTRNRHLSPIDIVRSNTRYSHRSPNWDRSRSPRWWSNRRSSRSVERIEEYRERPTPVPVDVPQYVQPDPYQVPPFPGPVQPSDFPSAVPSYPYPSNPPFPGGYAPPYNFIPPNMPGLVPQPVPAPVMVPEPMQPLMQPVMQPVINTTPMVNPVPAPVMAPPQPLPSPSVSTPIVPHSREQTTPYDALAQLVADGKLSQEDYMKLAPNKGKSAKMHGSSTNASMDTKTRVEVLNRCTIALSKLNSIKAPNRLVMNTNLMSQESKILTPKYCSPLKRQGDVEFYFTKSGSGAGAQQNKQLLEGIVQAVELSGSVLGKLKRRPAKNTKEVGVQTTKPFCEACDIREATERYDVGTSVDREQFSAMAQTQVEEAELVRSCAVFAPSGSVADGAPISIAHLTPAQLVSQLAARAKTLKQSPDPPPHHQFQRRNPPYNYDNRGGASGSSQYYRY